ncbi:glutathione S-transferase-like protein ustS [Colletotrichum liriopes]|uniref:Glutathione S-transferase-like protein ustS n=1 Tax=Colletotrichum liriopes TaxID=708192 RepID=A0AA37GG34_9PEZI|nr:glutathione S-transferase-like protein ustS [Colletotrichum liriopes]
MPPTSTTSNPIVFYDIATRPPVEKTCCSPNPWKARLALNFKDLPYSTSWVALPDISKVRGSLKVPPCRKFADGTDFFTLPIIEDPATDSLVGDSFDIAVYLQKTYPKSGAGDLFPLRRSTTSSSTMEYLYRYRNVARANFLNTPATAEATKAEFVRRAGVSCWDDFALIGEQREKMMDSFRNMLGDLAKLFLKDTSGPFLLGTKASYADLMIGAWLRMMYVTLPESEWEEVRSWHEGIFGHLYDALEAYAEVK